LLALERALETFRGILVFVSHDAEFREKAGGISLLLEKVLPDRYNT